jgi:hypothetical protein
MHPRRDRFGAQIGLLANEEGEPLSADIHRQAEVAAPAAAATSRVSDTFARRRNHPALAAWLYPRTLIFSFIASAIAAPA